ncbi:thioesterase family protein [Mycobacterium sp. E3247]|uniref:thioesterase family protein n=1 Tax=Mycobacterium sp. E3247 TaxID=1856864 RepID=UPI001E4CE4A0|nr:thioesterase family protein [Mycobacterium sp. E3247]
MDQAQRPASGCSRGQQAPMPEKQILPLAAQIAQLPCAITRNVSRDLIDGNGHMNVLHYLDFGSAAADAVVREIGIDDAYRADRQLGLFTVEHHLRYYSELIEDDTADLYARVLDRSPKVVHMISFAVDRHRKRLSATLEMVLVHVDLTRRLPVAMPVDIAAAFDKHVRYSSTLEWSAPVCGAMGVRRQP